MPTVNKLKKLSQDLSEIMDSVYRDVSSYTPSQIKEIIKLNKDIWHMSCGAARKDKWGKLNKPLSEATDRTIKSAIRTSFTLKDVSDGICLLNNPLRHRKRAVDLFCYCICLDLKSVRATTNLLSASRTSSILLSSEYVNAILRDIRKYHSEYDLDYMLSYEFLPFSHITKERMRKTRRTSRARLTHHSIDSAAVIDPMIGFLSGKLPLMSTFLSVNYRFYIPVSRSTLNQSLLSKYKIAALITSKKTGAVSLVEDMSSIDLVVCGD